MKIVLLYLKIYFCPRDIHVFVYPSSPLFSLLAIALENDWLKLNIKVYDVTNRLNKKLVYLEKEKGYDIKTLSIDRVLNKKHLKMCTKS